MRDLQSLTAARLLAVYAPEQLFSRSLVEAKREYRELARIWHPDCSNHPQCVRIFANISALYKLAIAKLTDGSWHEPVEKIEEETAGRKKFRQDTGAVVAFDFLTARRFELGSMYIGEQAVAFEVEHQFEDLATNGIKKISQLKFPNSEMALEMSNSLPQILEKFRTKDTTVAIIRKTPDQMLLADVLKFYSGRIAQIEHVGWILNCLYNIGCYLQWANLVHGAISSETVFISPLRHAAMLLGGWWYCDRSDARLHALPDRTMQFLPPDILTTRRTDHRIDLELIKSIGRELLGDAVGAGLRLDTDLPEGMVEWLTFPAGDNAIEDYNAWKHGVLPDSFGCPRFVALELTTSELYKEN